MGLIVKIPINKIDENNVDSTVEKTLKAHKEHAYTRMGLMIEKFGVKEIEINKPFSQWKKDHLKLYSKVKHSLEKLKAAGKLKSAKHGRAFVYWWNEITNA